jgi:hypothetical protein
VIGELAALGFWQLALPLTWWVPLFVIGVGLVGLSTVRRVRRQLVAARLPTRTTTALAGILLLIVLPLAAGWFGGSFAFERGLGRLIEAGGERVVTWSVTRGAASLQAALGVRDPQRKLPTGELRALIAAELAGNQHADALPPHTGPLRALRSLPQILDRAFWRASDGTLARAGHDLTWDELMVGARLALNAGSHLFLAHAAEELYRAARANLYALAALLLLGHALVLTMVWWRCRKHLKVEA